MNFRCDRRRRNGGTSAGGARPQSRRRAGGFSLAECLFACLLLIVISLAVGSALVGAQRQTAVSVNVERATDLAVELMQRIVSLPYTDPGGVQTPGPEAGETSPSKYDNMDDYHLYSEAAGQIKDAAGVLMPAEYQVFSRQVTAQYGASTVTGLGGSLAGLTATVTVTDGKGSTWTLTRFVPAGL